MREGGCAGLGGLKGTVYARMEEMSFRLGRRRGPWVCYGLIIPHAPAELTMYA